MVSRNWQHYAHLVHLLELGADGREAGHELVKADLAQVIVALLGGVTLVGHRLKVTSAVEELGLTTAVLVKDVEVGLGLGSLFLEGSDLGCEDVLVDTAELIRAVLDELERVVLRLLLLGLSVLVSSSSPSGASVDLSASAGLATSSSSSSSLKLVSPRPHTPRPHTTYSM
jgi:hypothetical protein